MSIRPLGPNQTELQLPDGTRVLYSYKTPVAAYVVGRGYLRTKEKFSSTTSRHINRWLGNCGEEVEQWEIVLISSGKSRQERKEAQTKRIVKL
jgi:hypothetical protein